MRNVMRAGAVAVAMFGFGTMAYAAGMADMAGKWKWTDFTIECDAGKSCKVTAGPKNVGMEMIQGALAEKDGGFVGDIKHPASGDIYKAKMTMKDANTWSMDGCTAAGVCAKGDFTRVK